MIWSDYQTAIFDHIADPDSPHLVVEACPGSGKTTTIVEALNYIPKDDSALFLAFNASIVKELKSKCHNADVMTVHGYGLRRITAAYGRVPIANDPPAVVERLKANMPPGCDRKVRTCARQIISAAKQVACTVPKLEDLPQIANRFGISAPSENPDDLILAVRSAHIDLTAMAGATPVKIDYDDMTWLPIVQGLRLRPYDWVLVDEAQDLNPVQLALLTRLAKRGARVVAIGDRNQSIYAFRGADPQAIPRIVRALDADILPLSVSYRCPRRVVSLAQGIIPQIEPAPTASDGELDEAPYERLLSDTRPGDLVISRLNAPLVSLAFALIAADRPCVMRGRDIGKNLAAFVRQPKAADAEGLVVAVREWRQREVNRLIRDEADPEAIDSVIDRAAVVELVAKKAGGSIDNVCKTMVGLFGDKANAIQLTSAHRAKGLEADTVWVMHETFNPEAGVQEKNLYYVAVTRAKKKLVLVDDRREMCAKCEEAVPARLMHKHNERCAA